ncbi:MAG: glycosyltransferase family 39 protein [Candidatus Eisenbacteria bacterium]
MPTAGFGTTIRFEDQGNPREGGLGDETDMVLDHAGGRHGKISMRSPRAYGTVIGVLLLCAALAARALASRFGRAFVEAAYDGGAVPGLYRLIYREEARPIEYYHARFDGIVETLFLWTLLAAAASVAGGFATDWLRDRPLGGKGRARATAGLICLVSLAAAVLFSVLVLERFPNSADEYVCLFQAETLREGRLSNPVPPVGESFRFMHTVMKDGKWVGQYTPGWPALLAAAGLFRVPAWLVNPILGALSLYVLFLLGRRLFGENAALLTAIAVLCSPFFVFNAASYFSHVSALLFVLLLHHHGLLFLDTGRSRYAALAGAWMGIALLIRPYTAVLAAVPVLLLILVPRSRERLLGGAWLAAGAAPFVLFLLVYNGRITGDPLLMVMKWGNPREGVGFIGSHSPLRGAYFTVQHLFDLMSWGSATVFVLAVYSLSRLRARGDRAWIGISVFWLVLAGYVFYWGPGGNRYGPRYHFEAYPFAMMGTAAIVFGERIRGSRSGVLRFLFLSGVVLGLLHFPRHVIEEHRVVRERSDVFRLVKEEGLRNAIVLLGSETGVIRPMPVHDLARNGVDLDGEVLYAWDLGKEKNLKLRERFPLRSFYRYTRPESDPRGALERLD